MGRFINKDPIEESGGLNLYGFCGNNGVNAYDYLGMSEKEEEAAAARGRERGDYLNRLCRNSNAGSGANVVGGTFNALPGSEDKTLYQLNVGAIGGTLGDWIGERGQTHWTPNGDVDTYTPPAPTENSKDNTGTNLPEDPNALKLDKITVGKADVVYPNSTIERINAGAYSILTDGTKVQIVVAMDYSDSPAATPEVANKFNKGIEKYWSGKFGKYVVKTFVTTATKGPRFNPAVFDAHGTITMNMNGRGQWDSSRSGWTAAHELGHGFGVGGDRYDYQTSRPDPGFEDNIMGGVEGTYPNQTDIETLLNVARSLNRLYY